MKTLPSKESESIRDLLDMKYCYFTCENANQKCWNCARNKFLHLEGKDNYKERVI